jgi:hypothetical protein
MSLKSFFYRVKKFSRFNLADKILPGYVFNKVIFKVGIALIVVWLLVAGYSLGFHWGNNVYVHCPDKGVPCENPFYNPVVQSPYPKLIADNPTCIKYGVCDRETLSPGESFGSPPSFFFQYAGDFAILIFSLMILWNHLLYNARFKGVKS